MLKLKLTLVTIFIAVTGFSQEKEFQTVLFPILDSMGMAVFIKPSAVKEYDHPKKDTKIYVFNYRMDTLGYYIGTKLRFVKLPKK